MRTANKYIDFDLIKYFLMAVFCLCSVGALFERGSTIDNYTVGEWLINYSGGFVRRGLSGSLLFLFSQSLGVSVEILINYFLIFLFAANIFCIFLLLRTLNSRQTFWLLFSPGLFLMVSTDTFDRKENLIYLMLMAHSLLILFSSRFQKVYQTYVLPLAGCLMILCHEIYVFFIPYHLLLILFSWPSSHDRNKALILNLVPVIFLIPVIYFHGSAKQIDEICKPLMYQGIACGGGIDPLRMSLQDSVDTALEILSDSYSVAAYLTCFLISNGVMFFLFSRSLKTIFNSRLLPFFIGCNLLFLIVLLLGEDFGRWITMFGIHNFCVLAVLQKEYIYQSPKPDCSRLNLAAQSFGLIILSLTFNLKYWHAYDPLKYPLFPGKLLAFLESGQNLFTEPKQLNFLKHTKLIVPINLSETIHHDDNRLYFVGWGDEQHIRLSATHNPAIFFKCKSSSHPLIGELKMAVGGVFSKQRVTVYFNDVKIGAELVITGRQELLFQVPNELIKFNEQLNRLSFDLPDAHQSQIEDPRDLSIHLEHLILR